MSRFSVLSVQRPLRNGAAIGGLVLAIAIGACSQPAGEGGGAPAAPSDAPSGQPINQSAEDSDAADPAIAQADDELAQIAQTVFEQVNAYREEQGLTPLKTNDTVRQQALAHSQAMAQGEVPVSHEGFDSRVEAIAKSVDYRSAAENVAYNEGYNAPGEQAVQGWLESPGHLENIRGNYDLTGIGVAQSGQAYYFTQLFIETPEMPGTP